MIKWIVNACPFAPGVAKPASMAAPSVPRLTMRRRLVSWKSTVLVLSFVSLTLLYSYSYPSLNYSGIPVLFQDGFFIKMSVYTYVTSMLGFYIKEYRRKR
jgi:hypothetical protein